MCHCMLLIKEMLKKMYNVPLQNPYTVMTK